MRSANERRRHFVVTSLIGWMKAYNLQINRPIENQNKTQEITSHFYMGDKQLYSITVYQEGILKNYIVMNQSLHTFIKVL